MLLYICLSDPTEQDTNPTNPRIFTQAIQWQAQERPKKQGLKLETLNHTGPEFAVTGTWPLSVQA